MEQNSKKESGDESGSSSESDKTKEDKNWWVNLNLPCCTDVFDPI